jgi:hypothetical protein
MKQMYVTCTDNEGDLYRVFPLSTGVGTSQGQLLIVYQDVNSNEIYHRTEKDFYENMKEVTPSFDCRRCNGNGYNREGDDCFVCGASGRSEKPYLKA